MYNQTTTIRCTKLYMYTDYVMGDISPNLLNPCLSPKPYTIPGLTIT